jgi:hypothetical protein
MSYGAVYLINGSTTYTTAEILALIGDSAPTGAEIVSAINSQLGSSAWQGGTDVAIWGDVSGTLSDQTDLQAALDAKADDSHTHSLSEITDVTVTSDTVSIAKGFRPGLFDDLDSPPVGTIIESSNDGHLYWVHRDGDVHLLCDSGGYGSGDYLPLAGGTMTGGIKYTEITHTPSGSTVTIDLGAANHQTLSLDGGSGNLAVTFTPPATISQGSLILRQNGATPRTVTWGVTGSSIFWQGSTPQVEYDDISDVRIIYWRFNGSIGLIMWSSEPIVDAVDVHAGGREITETPGGTSVVLTITNGSNQTLNLGSTTGATTVLIIVPVRRVSSHGTFVVIQHGTTPRNITWTVSSGTIVWLGTQPTWSSDGVGKIRIVYWRYNGSVTYLWSTASN